MAGINENRTSDEFRRTDPIQVAIRSGLADLGDAELTDIENDIAMLNAYGIASQALERLIGTSGQMIEMFKGSDRLAA